MLSVTDQTRTSLIDLPKRCDEADLLGMGQHTNALVEFLRGTDTPMTIGIQGEWGSGKTSLMNTLRFILCDEEKRYHPVQVNTWEHSLSGSPETTILSILQAVLFEVRCLGGTSETVEKMKDLGIKALKSMVRVGASAIGGDSQAMDDLLEGKQESISSLRAALQEAVRQVAHSTGRQGIIFFIDDLDRLDPTVAVRVLEILKNLFDLDHCVFVLAIDYAVVVKGLRAKFGEMTDQNEWEFRAFFDKIIQLPFTMPVNSYDLSNYLARLLQSIGYFKAAALTSERKQMLAQLAGDSIGANPRALKRLGNSIAIVSLLGKCRDGAAYSRDDDARLLEFGLICCQIAYPRIYTLLQRRPQFTEWDEGLALEETRVEALSGDDVERFASSEEFNEEWEKALYRICLPVETLRRNVFRISRLLNTIRDLCGKDDEIGSRLEDLLRNTSVTSVGGESRPEERRGFASLEELLNYLEKEKGTKQVVLDIFRALHEFITTDSAIRAELGEIGLRCIYAPTSLSYNLGQKRQRTMFVSAYPRKKHVALIWPLALGEGTKTYQDRVTHKFELDSPDALTDEVRQHIRKCCGFVVKGA